MEILKNIFWIGVVILIFIFGAPRVHAKGITAGHIVAGAVGYAVGKSGSSKTINTAPVTEHSELPIECYLFEPGMCNFGGYSNRADIPLIEVCQKVYGSDYRMVSFIPTGSHITVLCNMVK